MKLSKLLITLSVVTSVFAINLSSYNVVAQTVPIREVSNGHDYTVQWTNDDFGDYYKSINFGGSNLASQITNLIKTTHKSNTTYDGLKALFKESDRDPNKSGNILWFYTGTSVSFSGFGSGNGTTNREHVFPKNAGNAFPEKSGPGSDGHHLRPTEAQMNSTRGSKSFGEVPQTSGNICKQGGSTTYHTDVDKLCYTNSTYFYPGKGYRGQTARILFYVVSRWGGEYNLSFVSGSGNNKTIGDISTLLKWNLEEPVTQEELTRNEVVASKQGNRNPFIDNPYLACAIWGNHTGLNSEVKNACAQYSAIVDPYTGDVNLPSNPGGSGSGGNEGGSGESGSTTVNWGTSSNPITTTQAVENMKNFSDKETTSTVGYVKGIVTSVDEISSQYQNVTLTLDNKFIVFRAKTPNGTYDSANPEVKVGDEIVAGGNFQKYGTKDELINGTIISVKSSGSTTPDVPDVPDTPDIPDTPDTPVNPGGGTETEEISFDFRTVGVPNTSYTTGVNVTIQGKQYYFSDTYVGDSSGTACVRVGNNKASSAISDLGLSGSGSYLKPNFNLENCSSIELEVVATYSGTTGYKVLFKETGSSSYTVVKEGSLSGATTISCTLNEPKDGNFVIAVIGSKARADLGKFSIKTLQGPTIDLSSVSMNASATSNDTKSYLKFSAEYSQEQLINASKVGILVFSKNQLGNKSISELYTSGNLTSFKNSISKYDYLDFDFTSDIEDANYVIGASINNVKGHENYKFVAVSYLEISGTVYFTNQIVKSYSDCK